MNHSNLRSFLLDELKQLKLDRATLDQKIGRYQEQLDYLDSEGPDQELKLKKTKKMVPVNELSTYTPEIDSPLYGKTLFKKPNDVQGICNIISEIPEFQIFYLASNGVSKVLSEDGKWEKFTRGRVKHKSVYADNLNKFFKNLTDTIKSNHELQFQLETLNTSTKFKHYLTQVRRWAKKVRFYGCPSQKQNKKINIPVQLILDKIRKSSLQNWKNRRLGR